MQPAAAQPLLGHVEEHLRWPENLQQFLATEKFTHRMLPPVTPWEDMKPLDKLYANKKSKQAKVKGKRRYYESLAKDLMDPANAPKRATHRFETILEAMDRARAGYSFFYPYPEGTTEASLHGGPAGLVEESSHGDPKGKGKGKGKSKAAWQYIHYNLLIAGLEVPNARPPRPLSPPCAAGQGQQHWRSSSSRGSSSKGIGGGGRGGGHGLHPYQARGRWHEQP